MGTVGLAGAVADPDHVTGSCVPVAGGGIDPGQGLLIAKQQRLVAGEEIGRAQVGIGVGIDAAGAHEVERLGDPVGQFLIALARRRVVQEIQRPLMDMVEIGVTALGERRAGG